MQMCENGYSSGRWTFTWCLCPTCIDSDQRALPRKPLSFRGLIKPITSFPKIVCSNISNDKCAKFVACRRRRCAHSSDTQNKLKLQTVREEQQQQTKTKLLNARWHSINARKVKNGNLADVKRFGFRAELSSLSKWPHSINGTVVKIEWDCQRRSTHTHTLARKWKINTTRRSLVVSRPSWTNAQSNLAVALTLSASITFIECALKWRDRRGFGRWL